MRLGAYIMQSYRNAEEYVSLVRAKGYRAAYCPDYLKTSAQQTEIDELKLVLQQQDIVLAEVGTWVNPLSPNHKEREAAQAYLIDRLALADALGGKCCVNVLGSFSDAYWYAPCAQNYTDEFFEEAVVVYQKIIDSVNPKNTKMTFEFMPYCLLDDVQGYLRFLEALDRPQQAAVHLDPVNLVHDPRTLYNHRTLFSSAVDALGDQVMSVHIKDIMLNKEALNTQLVEVPLGCGEIDMEWMLDCLKRIPGDVPVMLEHLPDDATYDLAAGYLRKLAAEKNCCL